MSGLGTEPRSKGSSPLCIRLRGVLGLDEASVLVPRRAIAACAPGLRRILKALSLCDVGRRVRSNLRSPLHSLFALRHSFSSRDGAFIRPLECRDSSCEFDTSSHAVKQQADKSRRLTLRAGSRPQEQMLASAPAGSNPWLTVQMYLTAQVSLAPRSRTKARPS